jgi:hypothetical protein
MYTAGAVALLCYLVDSLPPEADRLFAEAEAGETVIHAPGTALAEVLYSVSRDKNVRGITLSGTPEQARSALVRDGPVALASIDDAELVEYAGLTETFSIHAGLVVASHSARDTDAIITSDGVIADSGYETVW